MSTPVSIRINRATTINCVAVFVSTVKFVISEKTEYTSATSAVITAMIISDLLGF